MEFVFDTTDARQSGGHGMLVLCLQRTYHGEGTNGSITVNGRHICHTIELPWRGNRRNASCIPQGCYRLDLHRSRHFGICLSVRGVPGRSGILIHPANDAERELKGCIAPVTTHTGIGRGLYSRIALERLEREVLQAIEVGMEVWMVVG